MLWNNSIYSPIEYLSMIFKYSCDVWNFISFILFITFVSNSNAYTCLWQLINVCPNRWLPSITNLIFHIWVNNSFVMFMIFFWIINDIRYANIIFAILITPFPFFNYNIVYVNFNWDRFKNVCVCHCHIVTIYIYILFTKIV